jgi:predicted dehydrogenase
MTLVAHDSLARVLVAGAGQLGSRYLQGLAACRRPLRIEVYDVDADALLVAEKRWHEVFRPESGHSASFHLGIDVLSSVFDVAIVATTAHVRPAVVKAVSAHAEVKNWILEKVLAQSETGLDEIAACVGPDARAWVNTPRRMLPWHAEVKALLPATGAPMGMEVDGGMWGLACNSIHFLDLFSWWSGQDLVSVDTSGLAGAWIEGKRAGNWEVLGTIAAAFSGGSRMTLHVQPGEVFYTFNLLAGDQRWQMTEQTGTAVRSDGLSVPGRIPFQSEVSGPLVDAILESRSCLLPTLEESIRMHRVFIRSLLQHWRATMSADANAVPIT